MKNVDMSAPAVSARLRRTSQLRRLCLSLGKAKLPKTDQTPEKTATKKDASVQRDTNQKK